MNFRHHGWPRRAWGVGSKVPEHRSGPPDPDLVRGWRAGATPAGVLAATPTGQEASRRPVDKLGATRRRGVLATVCAGRQIAGHGDVVLAADLAAPILDPSRGAAPRLGPGLARLPTAGLMRGSCYGAKMQSPHCFFLLFSAGRARRRPAAGGQVARRLTAPLSLSPPFGAPRASFSQQHGSRPWRGWPWACLGRGWP